MFSLFFEVRAMRPLMMLGYHTSTISPNVEGGKGTGGVS